VKHEAIVQECREESWSLANGTTSCGTRQRVDESSHRVDSVGMVGRLRSVYADDLS
jgi:hypothetical protein